MLCINVNKHGKSGGHVPPFLLSTMDSLVLIIKYLKNIFNYVEFKP